MPLKKASRSLRWLNEEARGSPRDPVFTQRNTVKTSKAEIQGTATEDMKTLKILTSLQLHKFEECSENR